MHHDTFQEQFDHEIAPLNQPLPSTRAIRTHRCFGELCEQLYLHALASYSFERLTQLDPANRQQHGNRVLYNLREASGRCLSGSYSAIYN